MLYVYAISDSASVPDVVGLRGAALSAVGRDGVFAVVSEHEGEQIDADESTLWEHEQVVEALLEDGTVLPMRFGSSLPGRAAVLSLLELRRNEFELGLESVSGAVEIGVRARLHRKPPARRAPEGTDPSRPGTSYLLARLNEQMRAAAVASHIHEPLLTLSRASVPRRTSLSDSVNSAYLVAREDVVPFQAAVEKLDDTVEDATIVCTGPWPPYSFTPDTAQ